MGVTDKTFIYSRQFLFPLISTCLHIFSPPPHISRETGLKKMETPTTSPLSQTHRPESTLVRCLYKPGYQRPKE